MFAAKNGDRKVVFLVDIEWNHFLAHEESTEVFELAKVARDPIASELRGVTTTQALLPAAAVDKAELTTTPMKMAFEVEDETCETSFNGTGPVSRARNYNFHQYWLAWKSQLFNIEFFSDNILFYVHRSLLVA